MSKFETVYKRIQEGIGTNNSPITPQKNNNDLDTLANTLAKEQNPAVIKKTLGTLVNPIPSISNQPSISMTGNSGPTTSTTTPLGQRTQSQVNTLNTVTPQQTNTQATKQSIQDDEVDRIINDIGVDRILSKLKGR